eukprot:477635_1
MDLNLFEIMMEIIEEKCNYAVTLSAKPTMHTPSFPELLYSQFQTILKRRTSISITNTNAFNTNTNAFITNTNAFNKNNMIETSNNKYDFKTRNTQSKRRPQSAMLSVTDTASVIQLYILHYYHQLILTLPLHQHNIQVYCTQFYHQIFPQL